MREQSGPRTFKSIRAKSLKIRTKSLKRVYSKHWVVDSIQPKHPSLRHTRRMPHGNSQVQPQWQTPDGGRDS